MTGATEGETVATETGNRLARLTSLDEVRPSAEYVALTGCCPNCYRAPWACECGDE